MGHLGIPLAGQGESVSLMACSFCRCHLVIIPRKPSARPLLQGTCFSSVFWVLCDWQEPHCVPLSIQTCCSTCLQHPEGQSGQSQRKRQRILTEKRNKARGLKSLEQRKLLKLTVSACFGHSYARFSSDLYS